MLLEIKAKLLAAGLEENALARFEKYDAALIERNLALAQERQPQNLAGFLIAACKEDWAGAVASSPPIAPSPSPNGGRSKERDELKKLRRKWREWQGELGILLSIPENSRTLWEHNRIEVCRQAIERIESLGKALTGR